MFTKHFSSSFLTFQKLTESLSYYFSVYILSIELCSLYLLFDLLIFKDLSGNRNHITNELMHWVDIYKDKKYEIMVMSTWPFLWVVSCTVCWLYPDFCVLFAIYHFLLDSALLKCVKILLSQQRRKYFLINSKENKTATTAIVKFVKDSFKLA